MTDTRILLADDDEALCVMLQTFLQQEGFEVTAVHNGSAALTAAATDNHDLLVLDIMLPGMQGLDVLRALRRNHQLPVIMLTARGDDTDRIVGLELGADDYLAKPCNPRELAARIRAVLRRAPEHGTGSMVLQAGALTLTPASRKVTIADKTINLTATEFETLELLLRNGTTITTKEIISTRVLNRPLQPFDRSIDMHISNLRKKLQLAGGTDYIVTHRGTGYSVAPEQH